MTTLADLSEAQRHALVRARAAQRLKLPCPIGEAVAFATYGALLQLKLVWPRSRDVVLTPKGLRIAQVILEERCAPVAPKPSLGVGR